MGTGCGCTLQRYSGYTHVHVISETVIVFMMSVASVVVQYITELAQTCVRVWVSSCGH